MEARHENKVTCLIMAGFAVLAGFSHSRLFTRFLPELLTGARGDATCLAVDIKIADDQRAREREIGREFCFCTQSTVISGFQAQPTCQSASAGT
ncbi:hypothetical protein PoB_006441800 [Plakobranchus ocellatus]|uniref:Uncharacterized protein n=1 Tax=Plakobranchus ocellatus TaxID=259542 RepID=A0AAV4D1K6_9GAST|nr:hypothetical protein PoB_006441800 [Plakobranchus ocellatus]